jgi:hypothetical protein
MTTSVDFLTALQNAIPSILTIATPIGAAVVWIVAERRKYAKETVVREDTEAERERTFSERVTNRLKTAEETIERLTREIVEERLKHNANLVPVDVLRTIIDNDPGISWVKKRVKSGEYQMVRVSAGYAKIFLKGPPELYDGKSDFDIWPKDIAAEFVANDETVYTTQEGQHVVELTTVGRIIGRKFPVRLSDAQDYIIGIGVYEPNAPIPVEQKDT